jgi:hypothetical protein
MKSTLKVLLVSILAVLWASQAFGQGAATGDLHITVKDERGNLITNATVTAQEQAKGFVRTTKLNNDGEYRLLSLPPGMYTVTVESGGFARYSASDQAVTVGQMRDLAVTLAVGSVETVVNVSSEAALVETSRSSTTDTIDQRRIDNLPINGRNYINFTLTDSQVVRDNAPNTGAAPTSGLNMSGQRARSNLVNVDGADATDNSINGVRSTVSQEAVQEFQIISNSYAAEYGRASGGVVNIITRSGSNEFHGDVFGYLRNRNFQAVNPFAVCLNPPCPNPAYTRVHRPERLWAGQLRCLALLWCARRIVPDPSDRRSWWPGSVPAAVRRCAPAAAGSIPAVLLGTGWSVFGNGREWRMACRDGRASRIFLDVPDAGHLFGACVLSDTGVAGG